MCRTTFELAEMTKLDALLRDWPQGRALLFADELASETGSGAAPMPLLAIGRRRR
jgi:hypothetical protein